MAKQYINVKILVEVSKHKLYIYFGEKKKYFKLYNCKMYEICFI